MRKSVLLGLGGVALLGGYALMRFVEAKIRARWRPQGLECFLEQKEVKKPSNDTNTHIGSQK